MFRSTRVISFLTAVLTLGLVASGTPAGATAPGGNGAIAYTALRHHWDEWQLRTLQPDGSADTPVADTESGDGTFRWGPTWSADGALLAWTEGTRSHPDRRIVVRDVAGGTDSTLVSVGSLSDTAESVMDPAFSPDGSTVAFCAAFMHAPAYRLFTIGVDGNGLTKISGDRLACFPDWSSTDRIAFTSGTGSTISTMDPDGSSVQRVTRVPFGSNIHVTPVASWSPDGSDLAFATQNGRDRSDVWVIGADGNGLTRLTGTSGRWETNAIFSPDGTTIAFSRTVGPDYASLDDLWTVDATGAGAPVRTTDTPRIDELAGSWQTT